MNLKSLCAWALASVPVVVLGGLSGCGETPDTSPSARGLADPAPDSGIEADDATAAVPRGEVELEGTFYTLGEGNDDPDHRDSSALGASGFASVGLLETRGAGLWRIRFPAAVALERGSTIRVRARADVRAQMLHVSEVLSTGPATPEATARMATDLRRRESARATGASPLRRAAGDGASDGPAALAPQPVLQMLIIPYYCDPNSGPAPQSPTPASMEALVHGPINQWMKRTTWNQRWFSATAVPWTNVCSVPSLFPGFPAHTPEEAALIAWGSNSALYDRVIMVADGTTASPTGFAESIPGRRAAIYGSSLDLGLWLHELGHLEGMVHAHALRCTGGIYTPGSPCASTAVGDRADAMSYAPFPQLPFTGQFSGAQAERLGWLGPQNVKTIVAPGAVDIAPYSWDPSAFPVRVVKVSLPSGTFYVEQRAPVLNDQSLAAYGGLTNGVLIHVLGATLTSNPTPETWYANPHLLDMTPATTHFDDAALPYGVPYFTPEGVRITAHLLTNGLTRVTVKFPPPLSVSQPRNVRVSAPNAAGIMVVAWDPPAIAPPGTTYEVVSYPGLSVVSTSALFANVGPAYDGWNAFAVRARANGTTTEYIGSNVVWSYPLPVATPSSVSITEPPMMSTSTALIDFTLPFLPGGVVTRGLGTHIRGVGPGFADPTDFTVVGGPLPFTTTVASGSVDALADSVAPEPNEYYDVDVTDMFCGALLYVPGCVVVRPVVDVRIPAH